MSEQVPEGGWKLGRDSFTVLVAWFKDGNAITRFSLDWKHRFSKRRDRELGLSKLHSLVQKYGSNAITVFISENDAPRPKDRTLIEYYKEGVRQKITDELRRRISGK